jgi:hypothetical protein
LCSSIHDADGVPPVCCFHPHSTHLRQDLVQFGRSYPSSPLEPTLPTGRKHIGCYIRLQCRFLAVAMLATGRVHSLSNDGTEFPSLMIVTRCLFDVDGQLFEKHLLRLISFLNAVCFQDSHGRSWTPFQARPFIHWQANSCDLNKLSHALCGAASVLNCHCILLYMYLYPPEVC